MVIRHRAASHQSAGRTRPIATTTSMTIAFRPRRPPHCCRRTPASRITASSKSASAPRATLSFSPQPMGQTIACFVASLGGSSGRRLGGSRCSIGRWADELKRLNDKGVRGVRFGTRLPGGAPMDDMEPVARKDRRPRLAHPARLGRRPHHGVERRSGAASHAGRLRSHGAPARTRGRPTTRLSVSSRTSSRERVRG